MSSRESNIGRIAVALLGLLVWIIHWLVSDFPRDSDASFFDGLVHGLSANVHAFQRLLGAEIGVRDFYARIPYELGLATGLGLLILAYDSFVDAAVEQLFSSGSPRAWRRVAGFVALALAALVLGLVFAEQPTPPYLRGDEVPALMGIIPGWLWQGAMLVSLNLMTAIALLLGLATLASLFGRGR